MVAGAARLLAERGLNDTSFSEVLALTGAPRGSIYHHFPNGKDQMVAEALALAGGTAVRLLDMFAGSPAEDVAAGFLGIWRSLLIRSSFSVGCSVVAVTVATDSDDLLTGAADVFRSWRTRLTELLQAGGLEAEDSREFAVLLIAASEGAVVISRAERSVEPFDLVSSQLARQVRVLAAGASLPG
jgi:TetR/AcrR family transcriptional regulator, lmrAB and yxaGH operons repressor